MKGGKLLTLFVGICLVAGLVGNLSLVSSCKQGAPVAAAPIKIGAPDALTGAYAADGILMLNGTIMAAEELNAQGGLLGRQLEVVSFDVEDMMAEKLMAAAEKLIGRDKVDVVVTSCNAAGPDVEAFGNYDVPYIHFDADQPVVDLYHSSPNYWNVFMVGDVGDPYGAIDFEVTQRLGYQFPNQKLAVIKADYEWDIEYANGFRDRAVETGWQVVMDETVPYGTSEWGPLLTKLNTENPSLIIASFYSAPDLVTLFTQWAERPTDSIICFGYGVSIPEFADMLGNGGNGICGTAAAGVLPTEEGRAWAERYKARFGEEAPKNASAATCYDEIMMWVEAVNRVGSVTDYRAICKAIEDYPYRGICGTYLFDDDHKVPECENYPQHFFQMQNGTIVTLYVHTTPVAGTAFQLPPWLQ
jgi:ABC-type branched-subunit amino acid transport system substrate-binding protein